MSLISKKLVTIFTESSLESDIITDIKGIGATGYSITEARGEGKHGLRAGDWEYNTNKCIQIICTEDIATKIVTHIYDQYFSDYSIIAYISDIVTHPNT